MFRIGIIGAGNMGSYHLNNIANNKIENAVLTAVCDIDPKVLEKHRQTLGDSVKYFESADELIHSGLVDGVVVATPHYFHPTLSIAALNAGLHVFCEKPAGVYTKNVREMNEVAKACGKTFQVNFVMRNLNSFKKIKELIDSGTLGEIKRVTWILTNWYRTQAYYNSGSWRATWGGEGGGTLLNQNPHQLDLFQWLFGMPKKVRGFCYFGKNRDIEVEDEATAYMEYENGAVATYMTTVGEYPGTNRLEVAGDKGKLVFEKNIITLWKLEVSEKEFNKTTLSVAGPIPMEEMVVEYEENSIAECQAAMITNWVAAATTGTPLIAPGEEGIRSLSLSNAIYLSAWNDGWVNLPIDEEEYLAKLNERIAASTYQKKDVVKIEGLPATNNGQQF